MPPIDPGSWPVESIPTDSPADAPTSGTGLCLSGGGYRAMLFHLGALWRLNELGLLRGLDRVSSVSCGSVAAGVLGTRWRDLTFDPVTNVATNFEAIWSSRRSGDSPARTSTSRSSSRVPSCPAGMPPAGCASALSTHLFGDATLQDLPSDGEGPRFVINATNSSPERCGGSLVPTRGTGGSGRSPTPRSRLGRGRSLGGLPAVLRPARAGRAAGGLRARRRSRARAPRLPAADPPGRRRRLRQPWPRDGLQALLGDPCQRRGWQGRRRRRPGDRLGARDRSAP